MRVYLYLFLIVSTFNAIAQPYIIYDSGSAISTNSYTAILKDQKVPNFRSSWLFQSLPSAKLSEKDEDNLFPITTTKLSPQYMSDSIDTYLALLPSPICIIGTDQLSMDWISKNLDTLREINAHCLLVSAPNAEKARTVLNALDGVPVYPARGDQLADYFKIDRFPVLITERYISQ